jgi:hypothetical protein
LTFRQFGKRVIQMVARLGKVGKHIGAFDGFAVFRDQPRVEFKTEWCPSWSFGRAACQIPQVVEGMVCLLPKGGMIAKYAFPVVVGAVLESEREHLGRCVVLAVKLCNDWVHLIFFCPQQSVETT